MPVLLTRSPGPTRPLTDPAEEGVLDTGEVRQYEFDGEEGVVALGPVTTAHAGTRRRIAVFPESERVDGRSRFGAADFTWRLRTPGRTLTPRDQHGHRVGGHPTGLDGGPEHGLPCWMPDQWTVLDLDLSEIDGEDYQLEMVVDPGVVGHGWIQDAGDLPAPPAPTDPVDAVHMTRGTHSREMFSRGNTLPFACLPHGTTFVTPLTNARNRHWLYEWAPDGGPRLQALAFSHCPSPWISEYGQFQLMPWIGEPVMDPRRRSMGFGHDDERDGVDRYRVRFDTGVSADVVPTHSGAWFRIDFGAAGGTRRGVVLDQQFRGSTTITPLPDGRAAITAIVESAPDSSKAHRDPVTYYYGETLQTVRPVPAVDNPRRLARLVPLGRRRHQAAAVELPESGLLDVQIVSSHIGVAQARDTLAREIGARTFADVAREARDTWNTLLGRLRLSCEATDDQRVTAYTNLARLHCWPNAAHEVVGDPASEGTLQYASPYHSADPLPVSTTTTSRVVDGELFVNNGFWDTYRTAWPHFHFFTPDLARPLLDGTVQQYLDGGWTARWSGPGYIDCMPGASADVVFADAAAHGLHFDEVAAYDSALRNACVPPPDRFVGRKGIRTSRFAGFTSTDVQEGMSWSLENAITDDAIAVWSRSLAGRADALGVPGRAGEFATNAEWFARRSLQYRTLFDPRIGFFQGRGPSGSWRNEPERFDPRAWGGDYTETNAWGMAVTPWHDGAGLAGLYGGEAGLAATLDAIFATQEEADEHTLGHYHRFVHEMVEARAIRCGMAAMSNQPAHHVPFMYLHAGQPWKTQWWTREMLDRLFVGTEIGQGYPGDEDNGEMSAWWLWAAMGLYPLRPGSGSLALTAPLFGEMSFDRGPAGRLTVRADHPEHRFVQWVRIDGREWEEVTVPVARLAGDVVVEFGLGPEPSAWGAASRPSSASEGISSVRDLTSGATVIVGESPAVGAPLIDDRGEQAVSVPPGRSIVVRLREEAVPLLGTITRADRGRVHWQVFATTDAGERLVADFIQEPLWRDQIQAFALDDCPPVRELRLVADEPVELTQIEFLG